MIKKIFEGMIVALISITIALCLLCCLTIFAYMKWKNYEVDKTLRMNKFDQKLWMDNYGRCTRGKMYYDLIDNYLKKGMSEEEVFKLLGKPNYGLKYPNNKNREYCLEYEIGECFIGNDVGRILSICLKNNHVIEIFYDSRNNDAEGFKIE